ncbi:MAG: KpsF/GutQ family sugar-phosphate isomerase [Alphaproteobacteria bacterium]|jgi:arabinose-5-phosphate isomerase|uniref:KpsF/GutQ family sugar-phosphate isomerase n=1 Tax=Pacificispira sp. TaxID=2888761 RepID=UPI001B1DDE77|nr:KpsF/GutQ family sugar-phosphate isomerase [Alphaproteobacteria bacterium]MBO6862949.1 KpsF/GutQ family sugar-phosphate isomerase [Alphaproteobacteria bacterium]MEC9267094.1 KpsF/GutQ family sugar-phosphate isomerase [Pseudomonadota bacterium]
MTARDTNGAKLSLAADAEAPDHPDIAAGRAVLTTEADALTALAATLDARFVAALDILDDVAREDRNGQHPPGRVIVSGMGKSGHIGRKIAATLASTGTPAQFVHPAEASHGDLGMITERDAVIALSNSGETQELSDLIRHVTRFGIPLISITGRGDSTLARAATVPLVLPDYPEAGALGLAPTTSTTMTLALGDALAVALLERKGFTAADFRILHPGGKLGHQLSMVGDLMHRGDELPLVPDTARMPEAMLAMTSKHFGCTGVVSADGVLVGIITDGDLRRHMSPELTTLPVTQVMTARPVTLGANTMAAEALKLMNGRQITAAFVVDDAERPVGIVHIHDFLRSGVA